MAEKQKRRIKSTNNNNNKTFEEETRRTTNPFSSFSTVSTNETRFPNKHRHTNNINVQFSLHGVLVALHKLLGLWVDFENIVSFILHAPHSNCKILISFRSLKITKKAFENSKIWENIAEMRENKTTATITMGGAHHSANERYFVQCKQIQNRF